MYLPYVIQYNRKDERAKTKYAEVARNLGYEGDDIEVIDQLIDKIREMNNEFGIDLNLKDHGVPADEFEAKKEKIAEAAVADACTPTNPREIDKDTMIKLLEHIYEGKDVDF